MTAHRPGCELALKLRQDGVMWTPVPKAQDRVEETFPSAPVSFQDEFLAYVSEQGGCPEARLVITHADEFEDDQEEERG